MYTPTHSQIFCKKKLPAMVSCTAFTAAMSTLAPLANAQSGMIEEVIVTATKREAGIQDIPLSISQISGDDLEARGINNIENLSYQIPNLNFGTFGVNTFITIRGIGTTVDSGVAEPAVASYIDGVFLPRSTMGVLQQVDMERVEVLRGPQGTLYGRNATGGSINYISRTPSPEFEGGLRAYVEDRDGYGISGFASGPVTDSFAYRISIGKEEQDGYMDVVNTGEDLAGKDLIHGRVALQFIPTDDLVIDLSVQYQENDDPVAFQQLLAESTRLPPGANSTIEPNKTYADGPFDGHNETTLVSARVNWDISDAMSFRSITGYVDHETQGSFDADASDAFIVNLVESARPSESYSQEFNLYGETESLSWLVGAFYFEEDYEVIIPVDFNGVGYLLAGHVEEDTESYAFFTDLTYSITDRLRLNLGLRYNAEEKDFDWFGAPEGGTDEDDWLPKVGLQYDVTDNANIYGSYQQGIKSGGHQLGSPAQFDPEELDSYELGIKSTLLDGLLTANAALFFYDYQDLQATTTIPPATTLVRNADAEVMGAELELMYSPSESWNLNFGLSLLDSEYQDFAFFDQLTQEVADLDGEDLIRSPEVTANFGAEWIIPIDSSLLKDIRLRGDLYYSDEYKTTFIDYSETRQDSYTTGNLSVMFTSPSESIKMRAYVDNVGDEEVLYNGSYLGASPTTGSFIGYYSEPRTYGVELMYNF